MSNPSAYEELLQKVRSAAQLEDWLEGQQGGKKSSVWEGNLWALGLLAAAALHYFMREVLRVNIDAINASGEDAGAQAALDLMPPQPASAQDLRQAVHAFLETQKMERDDTGRPPQAQPRDSDSEDVPPAAVSSALHQAQPERRLRVELIASWTDADRLAAFRWAEHIMAGGQAPPPEVLAKVYLEDLRLTEQKDRIMLLEWVGIGHPESADHWSEEVWAPVLDWAKAAHRKDRGEAEVEVPSCPTVLLPARQIFADLKGYLSMSGSPGAIDRTRIIQDFGMAHPGVALAVDALYSAAEITADAENRQAYFAVDATLHAEPESLVWIADAIARRAEPPKPKRKKPAPTPFYTWRVMTSAPLGGDPGADVALRYSHPDQRPEHLTGVALLVRPNHIKNGKPTKDHFPGTIDYSKLSWNDDPGILATYRALLVEELEEAVEQAKAEKSLGLDEPHVRDEDIAGEPETGKQHRLRAVKEG